MPVIVVRHKVQDYAKWRVEFDEHAATRKPDVCFLEDVQWTPA